MSSSSNIVIYLSILATFGTVSFANVSFCYYGSWSYADINTSKHLSSDINTTLCTHVVYAFIGLNIEGEILHIDEQFDIGQNGMANINALKATKTDLKTLISVGGWLQGSAKFSEVASKPEKRAIMIQQFVDFLNLYGFDGLDLAWLYPNRDGCDNGGREEDYCLDYIHLMTYDLHGVYDGVTGASAPLYAQPSDADDVATVSGAVNAWINGGATASKLTLGIGAFGKAYTLTDANDNGCGAPISGPGTQGPFEKVDITWSYMEICSSQINEPDAWTVVNHEDSYMYAYKGNLWIGYDDYRTTYIKAYFAREKGLGGVAVWSIDNDDFKGMCGGTYPILTAAVKGFGLME